MRKSLSLNGRPRNTNKAKGERYHRPGYVPSFSNVLSSVMQNGPREKTIEEQAEALIKNIKKLQKRIKKAQIFINVPVSRETEQTVEYRRKVARWEALLNKQIFTLHYLQARKDGIDKRELTKFANNSKDPWFVSKDQTQGSLVHHKLAPGRAVRQAPADTSKTSFNPQVKDSKKSTSKTTVYKDYNPKEPAWDKAEQEWRELVKANTRD